MSASLPPFLIFMLGAFLVAVTTERVRPWLALLVPIAGAVNILGLQHGMHWPISLFGQDLIPVKVDKLSLLFGYLFHLAAFLGLIFSLHVRDRVQQVSALIYAGSAIGAVFAGDLITLFVFWELLAVSSVFLILARKTARSHAAGMRYLIIQIGSGVMLLAGILVRFHATGSLAFDYVGLTGPGGWLIFLAIGIKCGFPMLHNWLTDSYPEATPTGAVFLSAFTTKVAVFALARTFPGTELLVYIGAAMAMFPIFYAVIENDLRRVLCYSMINQVGFMVVGIGLGTALGINGAVAHAFNDVLFKGLLFMTMGSVLFRTGKMNGSELGGLYKSMPITTGFCIVGAASISAFPLFSGFVSKSMIMVSALSQGHDWVWLMLLFASAGVFHHAGIKIPFFAFFSHDSGIRTKEPPLNMLIAMGLAAFFCVFNGSYPWVLYSLLPMAMSYTPYDATHVITQMQLLFFSAMAFAGLKLTGLYPPELPSTNLDAEWTYRRLIPSILKPIIYHGSAWNQGIRNLALKRVDWVMGRANHYFGPKSVYSRSWSTGNTTMMVAILLCVYLILYYI